MRLGRLLCRLLGHHHPRADVLVRATNHGDNSVTLSCPRCGQANVWWANGYDVSAMPPAPLCAHGAGLTAYCLPCRRVSGSPG